MGIKILSKTNISILKVYPFGDIQYTKLYNHVWYWPKLEYRFLNYFELNRFIHLHKYTWWEIKTSFELYIMDVIFTILVIHGLYQMAIRKFEMFLKSPHPNAQFFRWFWNHIRSKQGLSAQSIVVDTNHSYNSTRNLEQWGSAMRTRHLEVL